VGRKRKRSSERERVKGHSMLMNTKELHAMKQEMNMKGSCRQKKTKEREKSGF
jgi:hypothetical protein